MEGARALQFQSDPFLGWTTIDGRDATSSASSTTARPLANLADLKSTSLLEYAGVCGELLGRGHARAGDSAILAGYIGDLGPFRQRHPLLCRSLRRPD